MEGNQEIAEEDFTKAVTTDHWYAINTLEVMAGENASAIVEPISKIAGQIF